ncbi:sensor histidine kinase [bacterium D16-50]|nr:HAMP domain-containing histidine kinase [Lachnospiraceae bacterium]RKJ20956.1 sensor histidine kinase [bacterium D16-50]
MLYIMIDQLMNGFVVDWFEDNYVEEKQLFTKDGLTYYTKAIRWGKVKELLLKILIGLVIFWIVSVRLISVLYASRQETKVLKEAGKMIGDYMRQGREASDIFPSEYAPVSVEMAEIKAAMQRQEQLQKEEAGRKNDLITYLAHDLKTPLTSVIGYLSLMEEVPEMPAEQRVKYVHITLDKALRLERLINEFFEITRYNLQQIVLEKESLDLSFMLVQMADEFYPILSDHGNTLKLQGTNEESIMVYGDGDKLARVFRNILKNAIAYSYPDTEILVDCKTAGEKLFVTFSNKGKTIPRQKLEAIFEKFFRLDDARGTNQGGAGLGLAIAREIVTLHGGAIRAESGNEVTAFTVELPI